LAGLAALSLTSAALGEVKRQGEWPEKDTLVSLNLSRVPRDQAIQKLAEAAGWSVVVHAPNGDPVDVRVKDQPAGKVLDLLLLLVCGEPRGIVDFDRARGGCFARRACAPRGRPDASAAARARGAARAARSACAACAARGGHSRERAGSHYHG
jgi:hypothetical protein